MDQRIFHGDLTPLHVAEALLSGFNRGNLRAQRLGDGDHVVVQIASRPGAASGGETALTVSIQKVSDGIMVQVGQQAWLGVAASLGQTAIAALINPWNLIGRLDDIAQDIESIQLNERVWETINQVATAAGAGQQLSERLARLTCDYCGTANPVGEPNCIACGAPLGANQPRTCAKCGFVVSKGEIFCPNCGQRL